MERIKRGCIQDQHCDCNMQMWNAEEMKDLHILSLKSTYPNTIIHVEMSTRQCTSVTVLFVLTCFGNQAERDYIDL